MKKKHSEDGDTCWCEPYTVYESEKGSLRLHRYLVVHPDGAWRFHTPPEDFIRLAIFKLEHDEEL